MVGVEVVAGLILMALLATATWMAIVGLLGVTGCFRLRRCRSCGHLIPTSTPAVAACPYCRHPHLPRRIGHTRLHHYLPHEW